MKRRELIKSMAAASLAAGVGGMSYPMSAKAAAEDCVPAAVPDIENTLVNFMLNGGADLRFLFMPAPGELSQSHEDLIFASRREMFALTRGETNTVNYQTFFDSYYISPINDPSFGILRECGWLIQQFEDNRVAIISNAVCSKNRRHDQSIINANAGRPDFNELIYDIDGWGGRLVKEIGPSANAVELGGAITVFSQGPIAGSRLDQVIHAQNTRDIALPAVGVSAGRRDILTRALKSYYQARGEEVALEKPNGWPFHTFFNHNAAFRSFGDDMSDCMLARGGLPDRLTPGGTYNFDLSSNSLEQQCKNLYDVCLANDVLGARTISMSYGGWDTHGDQELRSPRYLRDIFGANMGLDSAMSSIYDLGTNAYDSLTFYFASDFGRQLVANGDWGTDHGRGTYAILIGHALTGGVYGDMFPVSETIEVNGAIPLQRHGADITGLTSTERILSEACDWVHPGSGSEVFPDAGFSDLEAGVSLGSLFT
jgi:uncharacterized protein (DUF1501 family)